MLRALRRRAQFCSAMHPISCTSAFSTRDVIAATITTSAPVLRREGSKGRGRASAQQSRQSRQPRQSSAISTIPERACQSSAVGLPAIRRGF